MSEYRVTWQREGQEQKQRRLYQTLAGAQRCKRIQATAHEEMTWLREEEEGYSFDRRPKPLVMEPTIEVREVGPWSQAEDGEAGA